MAAIILTAMCMYYVFRELIYYYRGKQRKVFYAYAAVLILTFALGIVMTIYNSIPGMIERIFG